MDMQDDRPRGPAQPTAFLECRLQSDCLFALLKRCALVLLWCITSVTVRAQGPTAAPAGNPELLPPSFLPKSPTATPFQRFDEQRYVDLMTGAAQFSIPLAEVSCGALRLPVALGYSYSGLKVFQPQDLLGMGWSLQVGGNITRQINGLPDEQHTARGQYDSTLIKTHSDDQEFLAAAARQEVDTAPDVYTFSVGGMSGRFTIQGNSIRLLPAQPLRIERLADSLFQLTTEAGVRYQFSALEKTKPNANNFGNIAMHTSAWQLTRVISVDHQDTVQLHYTPGSYQEPRRCVLTTGQYFYASYTVCGSTAPYTWHNVVPIPPEMRVQYLDSISARGCRVVFGREVGSHVLKQVRLLAIGGSARRCVKGFVLRHSWFSAAPNALERRLRLDEVQERNGTKQIPSYRFQYLDGPLPARNSAAQDYWGYYNGAGNFDGMSGDLAPALLYDPLINTLGFSPARNMAADRRPAFDYARLGALARVTYPTGGSTSLEYEAGSYRSDHIETRFDSYMLESFPFGPGVMMAANPNNTHDQIRRYPCDSTLFTIDGASIDDLVAAKFQFGRRASEDEHVAKNHSHDVELFKHLPTGDSLIAIRTGGNYDGDSVSWQFGLRPGTYKVRVFSELPDENNLLIIKIMYPVLVQDVAGPGIRVRRTVTATAGSPDLVRTYDYNFSEPNHTFSSGKTLLTINPNGVPLFETSLFTSYHWDGSYIVGCRFFNTSSDNNGIGNENNKYSFFYQQVTERSTGGTDGGGATVTRFREVPEQFNDVVMTQRLLYREGPNQQLQLAQRERTEFKAISSRLLFPAIRVRQTLRRVNPPAANGPAFVGLLEEYTVDPYALHATLIAPAQTMLVRYDERGDSLVSMTYSGYRDQRVVRTATRTSTGWQIARYKYLSDYNPTTPTVAALRNRNLNPVIEAQTWRRPLAGTDSVLVGGHLTLYDANWARPSSSWSLPLDRPQARPNAEQLSSAGYSAFRSDTRYQQDESVVYAPGTGLLQQRQVKGGPPTAYVWGYNRCYPVAQVENATFAEVLAVLGPATIDQLLGPNPGNDAQVRQLLAPLRTRLPQARVTSYTYQPLVGLTSQTDPSGRTNFYEYDDLGRLLRARDEQGYILAEQQYQYARP
jgi:YD repeat-containing protein